MQKKYARNISQLNSPICDHDFQRRGFFHSYAQEVLTAVCCRTRRVFSAEGQERLQCYFEIQERLQVQKDREMRQDFWTNYRMASALDFWMNDRMAKRMDKFLFVPG